MLGGARSYSFFCEKKFLERFLRNGVTSVTSIENIHIFLARLARLARCESDARDFLLLKNKNPQKNL